MENERVVPYIHDEEAAGFREIAEAFPLFFGWVREFAASQEEIEQLPRKLEVIALGQLRRSGAWASEQVDPHETYTCRNNVFLAMEKLLAAPMEFEVKFLCLLTGSPQSGPSSVEEVRLLHAKPFLILARHNDFRPLDQFRGRWYDPKRTDGGADILALACERAGYVPFPFEYGAVAHEQVIALELSSEAEPAAAYGSGIKALRYESFDFRMGFVTNTARNKARDLVKTKIKKKPEQPLEDVSGFVSGQAAAAAPARALKIDTSFVEACARVAIRSLSPQLRDQLYRHYVRGESWAIIADRYRTSPEAVRQNASRALKKIAKAIAGKIPGATDDVVSRLVEWLQDMLDRLW